MSHRHPGIAVYAPYDAREPTASCYSWNLAPRRRVKMALRVPVSTVGPTTGASARLGTRVETAIGTTRV